MFCLIKLNFIVFFSFDVAYVYSMMYSAYCLKNITVIRSFTMHSFVRKRTLLTCCHKRSANTKVTSSFGLQLKPRHSLLPMTPSAVQASHLSSAPDTTPLPGDPVQDTAAATQDAGGFLASYVSFFEGIASSYPVTEVRILFAIFVIYVWSSKGHLIPYHFLCNFWCDSRTNYVVLIWRISMKLNVQGLSELSVKYL